MSSAASEDELIAKWFAPIAGPAALGLHDDVALLTPGEGMDLIATVDTIVGGVHFFNDDDPASIARKVLRVNISDLAAKGSEPAGFLLSLALPRATGDEWLHAFAQGLGGDTRTWRCPLIGGDTVSTPGPLTLSVTALGFVPAGRMVARTRAQAGDRIYVSGTIGDAALGLYVRMPDAPAWTRQLESAHSMHLRERYLEPQPRLALARALRNHANGAMDVSDGLAGDLAKMMKVSGVSARVDLASVPVSPAAAAACALDESLFDIAMTGGDDYEIVCTVAPDHAAAFEAAAATAGVDVTHIGDVVDAETHPAVFKAADGRERTFARASYSHF